MRRLASWLALSSLYFVYYHVFPSWALRLFFYLLDSWRQSTDSSSLPSFHILHGFSPYPYTSINSLTTGLWVPVLVHLRVSFTVCLGRRDPEKPSSENRHWCYFPHPSPYSHPHRSSSRWGIWGRRENLPDRDHSFSASSQSGCGVKLPGLTRPHTSSISSDHRVQTQCVRLF